jgi:phosphoglycerate dehydrogenase-like enzyme/predicted dehydrogenase
MHLPVLAELQRRGRLELSVVCDIDTQRAAAAQEFGFRRYSGDAIACLQNADIDVVYIFASAQLHYEYGLLALEANKHVFVEKPVAPSFAHASEMARIAGNNKLIAVGGHNRRFYQSLAMVRARAGKTGWRSVEAVFHKPEFGKSVPFGARSWLSANGIHALDVLLFMMDELPDTISALAAEPNSVTPNIFSAVMRWPGGAQGAFLCNNAAGSRREEYAFHGVSETCRVTESGVSFELGNSIQTTALLSTGDGVAAEHNSFLDAIQGRTAPPHSLASIAPSLFVAELIENGFNGPVRLPPVPVEKAPAIFHRETSILVDQPTSLEASLAALLPHYRLVAVEEVERSAGQRPDILAAILGRGAAPLSPVMLSKLPQLSVVGVVGLSLSRYEPERLLARGITLINASSAYADSVAEFALGLAILGRRRAFISHELMRAGGWGIAATASGLIANAARAARAARPVLKKMSIEASLLKLRRRLSGQSGRSSQPSALRELRGSVAGLIGWGANAQAFSAALLRAGARVVVFSENAAAADIVRAGATLVSLEEALAGDIVSLHRGLTTKTRHFLGAAELAKLRPGCVLINVARGALIEPNALLERLRHGDIFACLDTFEDEPPPRRHELRNLANVFLTSHIAGGTADMHSAAAHEVVAKVAAYLSGKSVALISQQRLLTMT